MKYTRRQFLTLAGTLYCGALLFPSCITSKNKSYYRVLSDPESKCLEALCEQIIPADEYGGGATDAGVVNFIDKLLAERFPEQLTAYQTGIAALQASAQSLFKSDFQSLPVSDQIDLMERMEKNKLPEDLWDGKKPNDFFKMVIKNTMQGYYGSPRHGGNKDFVSYRMMKLDYPLLIGQNRY